MTARITRITATKPSIVTKTFSWINDKAVKGTSADVYEGHVDLVEVGDLRELASILTGLTHAQCLVYGIAPAPSLELVTERSWAQAGRPPHQVARTKDAFRWPDGPGILMLDYDPPRDGTPMARDELVATVRAACPGLADVEMLWWPSASSCIVNMDSGEQIHGIRGQRLYILAADARDIARAGKALCEHVWGQAFGRFDVSKSGALLERSLFDTSVWQSNRIDFAAGARCFEPLQQQRGEPVLIPGSTQSVDTAVAIPEPDAMVIQAASEHKAAQRLLKQEDADATTDIWVALRTEELAHRIVKRTGATSDQARKQAEAHVTRVLTRSELFADWQLTVRPADSRSKSVTVSVSEVLENPYRWHGCVTLDPVEPDYDGGRMIGKLYLVGARPALHSFAHGGHNYRLLRQLQRIEIVRGKLAETVDSLIEVLRRSPDIFDYGTEMATPAGSGKMLRLDKDSLRYLAASTTQFWRWHLTPHGTKVEMLENPPVEVAASILALRGRRGLKPLDAIISAPLMRRDGTILVDPGYDAHTRLLLDMTEPAQNVPERPSPEQLEAAFNRLWEPFEAFPFVGPVDRAVMLCALITGIERPVLTTSPAFAFDAPRQGTGKTLLAECVSILATGERPNAWPHVDRNEEETRKRLLTSLRSGARVLLWDNITGTFDSPSLAAMLTSDVYTDRVLGVSSAEAYPNRLVTLLTGNNFTPSGELPRRVMTCRLDAQSERPYTRAFTFNPSDVCMAHRQALVAAGLTLLRGYVSAGCPKMSDVSVGSFDQWDAMVRQAVLWVAQYVAPAGLLGDPLESILTRAESDPADDAHCALMKAWLALFGQRQVTARDLFDVYKKASQYGNYPTDAERSLSDALDEFRTSGPLSVRSVGRLLHFRRDRPTGGLQIVRGVKQSDGSFCWSVRALETPKPGLTGFTGFGSTSKNLTTAPMTHIGTPKVSRQTQSNPVDPENETVEVTL